MSDYIKKQLQKCAWANLNNYDPNTNTYHIPKYSKPVFKVGGTYIVKIPADIVNNRDSILATNWNNGLAPKYQYLKIYISKMLGANIYVDSIGYDINTNQDINDIFSGWLDATTLEQIAIL